MNFANSPCKNQKHVHNSETLTHTAANQVTTLIPLVMVTCLGIRSELEETQWKVSKGSISFTVLPFTADEIHQNLVSLNL